MTRYNQISIQSRSNQTGTLVEYDWSWVFSNRNIGLILSVRTPGKYGLYVARVLNGAGQVEEWDLTLVNNP